MFYFNARDIQNQSPTGVEAAIRRYLAKYVFLKFRYIHSKTSVLESLFNKVAELCYQHRCFPVNIANFLRTAFLQNTSSGCFCRCFIKKALPKNLRTLLERIAIIFNQDAGLELATLSKQRMLSCEFCEILQRNIKQNNGCSWTLSGVVENKCSRN